MKMMMIGKEDEEEEKRSGRWLDIYVYQLVLQLSSSQWPNLQRLKPKGQGQC